MARLVAGPVTDFNVMSRRGVAGHSLAVMREGKSDTATPPASLRSSPPDRRV
jgi:environmental stress-induced protein Ves